jgi:hypothetical protein
MCTPGTHVPDHDDPRELAQTWRSLVQQVSKGRV